MAGHVRRRRGYHTGSFLLQVISWAALLAFGAVLLGCVVVPKLAGATPYTVLTGSMRPGLPPGTLVVVRPVAPKDVRLGDVVTYQLQSGKPEVVTHRVVSVGFNAQNQYVFRTEGDANEVPDTNPVKGVQIRGRLWYAVPYIGRLAIALDGRARAWATTGLAGGLLAYAAAMFLGAYRDRRQCAVGRHRRRAEA